ncbi:MAG: phosphoribosylformylglycinamidine synthase, partial [Thauera sp.]
MTSILKLRGAAALSTSRLERLSRAAGEVLPRLAGLAAEHWYFVELQDALDADERARLVDMLDAHPASAAQPAGTLRLVVPRLGTISPWSSKATDIAHQCGFDKIVRIERGIAYSINARGVEGNAALIALLHDRMTESVLSSLDEAEALFHHYEPQPLTTVDIL